MIPPRACMDTAVDLQLLVLKLDQSEAAQRERRGRLDVQQYYYILSNLHSKTGIYTGAHMLVLFVPILLYMFLRTHIRFQ